MRLRKAQNNSKTDNEDEVVPEVCICGVPSDSDYIGCDSCSCWWHYTCIGFVVNEELEKLFKALNWECPKCVMKKYDSKTDNTGGNDIASVVKTEIVKILPDIVKEVVTATTENQTKKWSDLLKTNTELNNEAIKRQSTRVTKQQWKRL